MILSYFETVRKPGTIYLCDRHGIFKSTDGGQSCRLVSTCSS